jgi:hypothetical protein
LSHLLFSSVKTAVSTRLWPAVITESICWRPRPCYGVKNTFEMSAYNTEKSTPARYCYTELYRQCTCTICICKTLFIADVRLVCSLEKIITKIIWRWIGHVGCGEQRRSIVSRVFIWKVKGAPDLHALGTFAKEQRGGLCAAESWGNTHYTAILNKEIMSK